MKNACYLYIAVAGVMFSGSAALAQTLTVSPNSFDFGTYTIGSETVPAARTAMVTSSAGATTIAISLNTSSTYFLAVLPPSGMGAGGTTPAALQVRTAPAAVLDNLKPGTYTNSASIFGPAGFNTPVITATLTIAAKATPLSITTASLPQGLVNKPYSATIVATGGTPPYTFSATLPAAHATPGHAYVNDLPPGLSISTSGNLNGTPTTALVNGQIVVTVTDSRAATATKTFILNILPFQTTIISGNSQTISVGSNLSLVVEVDDPSGNPIANAQVQFIAPGTGPSGTFDGGGTSTVITTGPDGRATTQFTAGTATGAFTIAVIDPVSGAFLTGFSVNIVPPPPSPDQPSLVISSGASTTTVTPANSSPASQKFWGAFGIADTSTNNSLTPLYSSAPNPQIAVGPDDILMIVNRTIARYPNPNAAGNPLVPDPANNPPTDSTSLNAWLGTANLATLCPSNTDPGNCIVDNGTIRYDQLSGRFIVLFTVTDLGAQTSNFALTVSNSASGFQSGQFFNTPAVGGSSNSSSWTLYPISINVNVNGNATNYFPTAARFGLDNDNIILTAPVLDQSQGTTTSKGTYSGTRVVTVPKVAVYNLAPTSTVTTFEVNLSDNLSTGTITVTPDIPRIFWEPDNLRGRALASFDSQVNLSQAAGVVAPIDYLVGSQIGSGGSASQALYIYRINFNCPAGASSLIPYCTASDGTFSPSVPSLGPLTKVSGFGPPVADPAPVAQGDAVDGTSMANNSLFVGDSRPEQVIFREGLLYVARTVRPFDASGNGLGSSTVTYDVLRQPPGGSAAPLSNLYLQPASQESLFGFYAPMFDVPASVPSNSSSGPFDLNQFILTLKAGGTAFGHNYPSLWDFHPGDDAYDQTVPNLDPVTGATIQNSIPFGNLGGASTDPNDGSLWCFGEFAKNRASTTPGPGQWGTAVANYPLAFATPFYVDVPTSSPYFNWVQMAKNLGIVPFPVTTPTAPTFSPDTVVTRGEMAAWVVLSQMDDAQVNTFLSSAGGAPGTSTAPFFSDTAGNSYLRYIEVAARRGIATSCGVNSTGAKIFCPNQPASSADMAVFLIRAKMGNVFPTTLIGVPLPFLTPTGAPDLFGAPSAGSDPSSIYIQKMQELRIVPRGTTFSPDANLTRKEVATFVVRAFFL